MSEQTKRLGPAVRLDCHGCHYHRQTRYAHQGDSGYEHYCVEKSAPTRDGETGYIGDSHTTTPDWCPMRAVAVLAFVEAEKEPK